MLDEEMTIFDQLILEEHLLRNDFRNFCVVNKGSSPAIVMGISGKAHELVDLDKAKKDSIPIIKRFSGGGTVIVDTNTIFVTFIFQKDSFSFPAYPEKIMKWTEEIYKPVFPELFALRENDYTFDALKFGGNAQYIKKDRWLHHTSFLWDFENSNMDLLLHPKKTPSYRDGRSHQDFLCKLKDHLPSKDSFILNLKNSLTKQFEIEDIQKSDIEISSTERVSTVLIS
ncbi:MAG: lipoate--protein ligase family protein [Chlamydiae bacterium]|nr:lipoate--protein ligase family protein [Chlamydiota bacterium]